MMDTFWGSTIGRRTGICLGVIIVFFLLNGVTVLRHFLSTETNTSPVANHNIVRDESKWDTRDFTRRNSLPKDNHGPPVAMNLEKPRPNEIDNEFEPVRVVFYEGFRGERWIFDTHFRPFYSEVKCLCSDDPRDIVIKQMVSKRYEIRTFDIVVFPYDVTVLRGDKLFWERLQELRRESRPNQRWVYATRECPVKLKRTTIPTRFAKNSFDWSLTYRSNSDFPSPYGYYKTFDTSENRIMNVDWAAQKTGIVAWMSSNNLTTWHRQKFVQTLNSLVKVDIYGKNGMKCGRSSPECEQIMKRYKFYLALENSCCDEYITEKLWRTLTWGSVPIVLGTSKRDYMKVAPPNSFIHADDFDSMEALAQFILKVDNDDLLYNSFLEWKEVGFAVNAYPDAGTDSAGHNDEPPEQLYYSCKKVCEMARKYRKEEGSKDNRHRTKFFNPKSGIWDESCGSCASHGWIKAFEKEQL